MEHVKLNRNATYFVRALSDLSSLNPPAVVLEFGCGKGDLAKEIRSFGFECLGCDFKNELDLNDPKLRMLQSDPYKIPFEDNTFDAVISSAVLEHAKNKKECFLEIRRVLKPGGSAIHIFPAKWHLPTEPHILVPFVNFFLPSISRAWLSLWALIGVRNHLQLNKSWREVVEHNIKYCNTGLSYWSSRSYERLSLEVFGNFQWPMAHFVSHSDGGFGRLARRFPFPEFWGLISREVRHAVLVHKKSA